MSREMQNMFVPIVGINKQRASALRIVMANRIADIIIRGLFLVGSFLCFKWSMCFVVGLVAVGFSLCISLRSFFGFVFVFEMEE